jgi:AcrR family transcriptional regulator
MAHAAIERAAFAMFERKGFEISMLDDIADAPWAVGRRTLFRYYRSKNDILWGQFDIGVEAVEESSLETAIEGFSKGSDAIVQRHFTGQVWVTDISGHPIGEGRLYCCDHRPDQELDGAPGLRMGHLSPTTAPTSPAAR